MEFVKKKVGIDVLNPVITSPTTSPTNKVIINTPKKLQQKPTNCLSVLDHSVGLALKVFTASFC